MRYWSSEDGNHRKGRVEDVVGTRDVEIVNIGVIHVVRLSYTEKVDTPVTVACVADSEEGGSTKVPLEY
jgi:hypothetical protein